MFEKILLAVNGSEHSMRAAKEADNLVRADEVQYFVVLA